MKLKLTLITIVVTILPAVRANAFTPPSIPITSLNGPISFPLNGYDEVGGFNLALADLGTDGVSEIIVAGGLGSEPRVRVLRQDGSEIGSFLAYAPTMGVGINVIACDLTGDGYNEIITVPQRGGGPHVRVFNRMGEAIDDGGFFAYAQTLRTGVNLACGDLIGDERAELVTLPAPGGGPHVRVWSLNDGRETLEKNFFAFHESNRTGLVGVVRDKQLIVAQQFTQSPIIKTIVIHSSYTINDEKNFPINALGLRSLAVFADDVYLFSATGNNMTNTRTGETKTLSSENSSATIGSDSNHIIFAPAGNIFSSTREPKHIEVDISQQRLYAYEYGILQNTFLISSGKNNTTPLGNHTISAKLPTVHYTWTYGKDDPRNYDLGLVPYNLRITPHIYIHYAYWHNNFGNPMSRGCVNVALDDMKWIYGWAQEGVPVKVKE